MNNNRVTSDQQPPANQSGATDDADFIRLFLNNRGRNSAHTLRAYTRTLHDFSSFVVKPLTAVTLADMEAYQDLLTEKYPSVNSRNQRLSIVRCLRSFGHKIGYLHSNVGAALTLQSTPETLSERILSEADAQALFVAAANNRERLILRTLYYSACRVSELCALQWKHLNGTVLTIHGKDGKTRHVTLPSPLIEEISNTKPEHAASIAPLFPRPRSGKAITQVDVHRIVKHAAKAAGIGPVSPHWLRHAHASHSLSHGASIAVVQKTLGNSNVATTGRYLHVKPGESSATYLPGQ